MSQVTRIEIGVPREEDRLAAGPAVSSQGSMGAVVLAASYLAMVLAFFFHRISLSHTQSHRSYSYEKCSPSTCGNVSISFPFSLSEQVCGLPGYGVWCDNGTPRFTAPQGKRYAIRDIYYSYTDECVVRVTDTDLVGRLESGDCGSVGNHSFPTSWAYGLTSYSQVATLTVYSCPKMNTSLPEGFASFNFCRGNSSLIYSNNSMSKENPYQGPEQQVNLGSEWSSVCNRATLPVTTFNLRQLNGSVAIFEGGFHLQWPKQLQMNCTENCENGGGRCGFNETTRNILCFCKDGSRNCANSENSTRNKMNSWKVVIAVVIPTSVVVIVTLVSLGTIYTRRGHAGSITNNSFILFLLRRKANRRDMDAQEFINKYKMMLPTQYSYSQIKKMTEVFKHKLGRGGYGNVFKGTSPNGIPVAVKVLERSSGSSGTDTSGGRSNEDFFNEVATIGRIHHVNIIRLLGFCCDGSCRALVYEFMPNGSLADLLTKENHGVAALEMLRIGVEIARGIEYLHQGCDSRILHLDIKPHNVLLDQHLHAKISDFGMAKSYSRKDSAVRLTGARGTIGYIAPEVFLRNLGGVTHKSDVYSYGMLLLEMSLGGKNNYNREAAATPADAESSSTSSKSAYFPDWVYDKLDQWDGGRGGGEEIAPVDTATDETEVTVLRATVLVGLWCIQTRPVDRPSISEVLKMLTGKVQNIPLPPKPVLFSPAAQLSPLSTLDRSGSFPSS